MTDYPPPAHAAMIWLEGETIWLRFPPTAGHDKGHCIHLHTSELAAIKVILEARTRSVRPDDLKVGTPAAPVQYDLERIAEYMRSNGVKRTEPKPARFAKRANVPTITLEELGL